MDGLLALVASGPDLDLARSLFATKWWDYRFIHPGHALFYLADCYAAKSAEWAPKFGTRVGRKNFSYHPIWKLGKLKGQPNQRIIRPKAQRTGLWRLMCVADAHGIPYPKYLSLAFQNCIERGWGRIPTPIEMYSTIVVSAVVKGFEAEKKELLQIPTDPHFRVDAYTGHEWQDEFQRWLAQLVAARPAPHYAAFQYMVRDKLLHPKFANETLSPYTMGEVRRMALT